MNVPAMTSAPVAPSTQRKPAASREGDDFKVPSEPPEARDPDDRDDDAPITKHVDAPRAEDLAAWMLPTFAAPPPPSAPPRADPTDLDAHFAPVPAPIQKAEPAAPSVTENDTTAHTDARSKSVERTPIAVTDAKVEAPPREAPQPAAPTPARRDEAPPLAPPPAPDPTAAASTKPAPSPIANTPVTANPPLTANGPLAPRVGARSPRDPSRDAAASSELAASSLTSPDAPWANALSSSHTRLTDKALTPVNGPTVTAEVPSDPLRARLQEAHTSALNQRTLQGAAQGELVLPELGRVTVSARLDRDAVSVEIRASEASTAQHLHARADALAADVRAADIPLRSMRFEGAGTWTPSDAHTPSREHHGEREAPVDESATPSAGRSAASKGRVRIVL